MTSIDAIIHIARCPVHGLHGARATCFAYEHEGARDCDGVVEQVAMLPLRVEHGAEELLAEANGILRASAAFDDRHSRIYDLLAEIARRLRNGGHTIGAYQQLTGTDYPGTLAARLANGDIVIRGRAQHPPVGCTEHRLQDPTCAWCRTHAIEYARAGGSSHDEVAELRRRLSDLERQHDVMREAAARLQPMARRAIAGDEGLHADLVAAITHVARGCPGWNGPDGSSDQVVGS